MSGYIGASSQGIITNVDGGTVENITELSVNANSTTNLVTITQTGSGNALVVEDSANPDATPFVIDASGNVGIGTSSINKSGSYQALTLNVPSGQYGAIELATGDTGRWYINADSTNVYDTAMNNTNRVFYTGGSERMRIDSSGRVGIGTGGATVNAPLELKGDGTGSLSDHFRITSTDVTAKLSLVGTGAGNNSAIACDNGSLVFYNATANNPRMSIDNGGNVGIGMNSPSGKGLVAAVTRSDSLGQITAYYNSSYAYKIGTYSNGTFLIYADDTGNPGVYLNWRGTSWNSNSDERLKTDLLPIENAVEKLCSLRTVTGRYLIDDESVSRSFLIAQDFVERFPEPLSESPDGFLGLSYTDVIPLMIAGFKEQQAIIESQQTQIDSLQTTVTDLLARVQALETV